MTKQETLPKGVGVAKFDEKSTLQKEVEDNDNINCLMKRLLKQAILAHLKMAVGDCAKHECQGCRIDHPSQKYHDMCL